MERAFIVGPGALALVVCFAFSVHLYIMIHYSYWVGERELGLLQALACAKGLDGKTSVSGVVCAGAWRVGLAASPTTLNNADPATNARTLGQRHWHVIVHAHGWLQRYLLQPLKQGRCW
jgi:hypothetical protein